MKNYINNTGYWYKDVPQEQHAHSLELSEWIKNYLFTYKEKNIFDFGCGNGNYLKDLKDEGFKHLLGLEGDPIQNEHVEILKKDLTSYFDLGKKGTIISLEVGEHIPKEYENIYLENLNNHCENNLILSWAIRGQGGYGHVNELNNDEIIPKIEAFGFKYLQKESNEARGVITNCGWFKNTLMVFKK